MQTEIIFAGFGGQGVLFSGQLLAYTAMEQGKYVTWIPSYGPEMRGGTANCTVIIADDEIGSPFAKFPQAVVAMNLPSLDKYENMVKPGGILVINTSLINRSPSRKDILNVLIPGNEVAETIGDKRVANMVMLGGLVANKDILPLEAIENSLKAHTPERQQKYLPLNLKALEQGATYKGMMG